MGIFFCEHQNSSYNVNRKFYYNAKLNVYITVPMTVYTVKHSHTLFNENEAVHVSLFRMYEVNVKSVLHVCAKCTVLSNRMSTWVWVGYGSTGVKPGMCEGYSMSQVHSDICRIWCGSTGYTRHKFALIYTGSASLTRRGLRCLYELSRAEMCKWENCMYWSNLWMCVM